MRALIILLAVANLAMWAAVHGSFGPAPAAGERAPWRLGEEIRADSLVVRVLPPAAPKTRGKRLHEHAPERETDCGDRCGAYL
ncbi:MAG: hypothetical protein ACRYG5_11445 [Janthinobacterium lividum]